MTGRILRCPFETPRVAYATKTPSDIYDCHTGF